jgi:flagellar export protein FliJ
VSKRCFITAFWQMKEKSNSNHQIGDTVIALKQYRFKLQAVLDYRAEQLNKVQQKVAEEEHKKQLIQKRIQEFDMVIDQAFQDQQQQVNSGMLDFSQLQHFPDYIWRLKQNRFQQYQALQAQERVLNNLRNVLQQALIKKKALDTLKEKDFAKYRKELEKVEEEFLAEIALTRATRKSPVM